MSKLLDPQKQRMAEILKRQLERDILRPAPDRVIAPIDRLDMAQRAMQRRAERETLEYHLRRTWPREVSR